MSSRTYEVLGWSFETTETFDLVCSDARPADARFCFWSEAPGEWTAEPEWYHRADVRDGRAWPAFGRTSGGYVLHFEGVVAFGFTRDGCEVDAICHDGADLDTVKRLFLDQVVPLILTLQGRDCLHASAVALNGAAIAFAGVSGAGKSTLAAALTRHGAALVSDDCLALRDETTRFAVHPGHAASKLWRDSAEALAADTSHSVAGHADKLWHGTAPHAGALLPLHAIYLVSTGDAISIAPAAPQTAIATLLEAAFRLDLHDANQLTRQFERLTRLANTVPIFELRYPRDFTRLDELCTALVTHARTL